MQAQALNHRFTIPDTIGKYKVGKVLGVGSFSVVVLCSVPDTQEVYACKLMNPDAEESNYWNTMELMHQYNTEKSCLEQLNHPNIVKLIDTVENVTVFDYDATQTHCLPAMILEYAKYGELFEMINKLGPIDALHVRRIAMQVFNALRHCHSQGIVHADLKLEQILIAEDFSIKLCDFGLSQYSGQGLINTTILAGTVQHSPPEVYQRLYNNNNNGFVKEKISTLSGKMGSSPFSVDYYGLGIILFICCTGMPPFRLPDSTRCAWFRMWQYNTQSYWDRVNQNVAGKYGAKYKLSPDTIELLSGLLCIDANDRWGANQVEKCAFMQQAMQEFDNADNKTQYEIELRRRLAHKV